MTEETRSPSPTDLQHAQIPDKRGSQQRPGKKQSQMEKESQIMRYHGSMPKACFQRKTWHAILSNAASNASMIRNAKWPWCLVTWSSRSRTYGQRLWVVIRCNVGTWWSLLIIFTFLMKSYSEIRRRAAGGLRKGLTMK
jgi:hypothetical protein